MNVCAEDGCPELTDSTRCEVHRKEKKRREAARRRHTPAQQMYAGRGPRGKAWRKARAEYVRFHPICEDESGCLAPVDHVHHRDGDPLGPRGLDPENLQGLCLSHHSRKTAREQPGGWHAWSAQPN